MRSSVLYRPSTLRPFVDRKSEQINQLRKSTRNENLIELMELEKTIVYFRPHLRRTSAWLEIDQRN